MTPKLIDSNELESEMYHNAFDNRANVKIWNGQCWIRYKLFENTIKEQKEVEAIPKAWIKKWREHKWFSSRPIEERIIMAMGVRLMLEDWEMIEKNDMGADEDHI